jgi:hypothetical protein
MPEQDRQARTAALHEEIGRAGLEQAGFGAIAQAVALQHGRNLGNELEAARLREAAPPAPAAELAPADLASGIA